MARDVESLAIAMKALTVDSTMYEVAPATPPVPFRSQVLLYCFSSVLVQLLTSHNYVFIMQDSVHCNPAGGGSIRYQYAIHIETQRTVDWSIRKMAKFGSIVSYEFGHHSEFWLSSQ